MWWSIDDTGAVPMPVLLTAGALELRAVRATDLDSVHKIFSADSHTIGTGPVTDVSVTEAWVRRLREIAQTTSSCGTSSGFGGTRRSCGVACARPLGYRWLGR